MRTFGGVPAKRLNDLIIRSKKFAGKKVFQPAASNKSLSPGGFRACLLLPIAADSFRHVRAATQVKPCHSGRLHCWEVHSV